MLGGRGGEGKGINFPFHLNSWKLSGVKGDLLGMLLREGSERKKIKRAVRRWTRFFDSFNSLCAGAKVALGCGAQ